MLIHDYAAYKIWENELRERESETAHHRKDTGSMRTLGNRPLGFKTVLSVLSLNLRVRR